jgi:GrpB-like predicted nucleotidyltransferase (UPF0157 family)
MSLVVATDAELAVAIERLASLGYVHRGNLGIEGREVLNIPDESPPHNLYACPRDSPGLANHLAVRDYLRTHPEVAKEYGELKKRLAREFPIDIESCVDGKTDLILKILRAASFPAERLAAIERENRQAG